MRNQFYRDKEISCDVLLQSATAGSSQESEETLTSFPATKAELNDYDAIFAFDPNWMALSEKQIDLLEEWVADSAGGLVLVPGPVYTRKTFPGWMDKLETAKIKNMYPVEFFKNFAISNAGRFKNEEAWPLDITRDGMEADFMSLKDDALLSQQVWKDFKGVYGYYTVKGPKPKATVYAYFSNPASREGGNLPVYFAGQFYGSGKVFYMGSGEMWRIRSLDPDYFERFYTKVLRHVSEGRLTRGSQRGILLMNRDRFLLGQTVQVEAKLQNEEFGPLTAPSVPLNVITPKKQRFTLQLKPDTSGRAGVFVGQFPARLEGTYRLEMLVPGGEETELLSRRIQVAVPDLERENPQRNKALMKQIADETKGITYASLGDAKALINDLEVKTKITVEQDKSKKLWDNAWILGLVVGLLCMEWLIRRVAKLA